MALSFLTLWAKRLLFDPKYANVLALLILLGDGVLTELIIAFVPYTEIDWETYMYHIDLINGGERNYTAITGPTGPLVYPAGHVQVYKLLHDWTSSGLNIRLAQHIFGAVYLDSVLQTCRIYLGAGGIPNWVLLLLPLSKRLHSIYALRLFNDCWAVVAALGMIQMLQKGNDLLATLFFSLAISVKMSALLYLPGLLLILWKRHGIVMTASHMLQVLAIQYWLGKVFVDEFPREYLKQAFDFSRVFLFKWTVNWRFLGEDMFLSQVWSNSLLVGHVCTLLLFAHFKWCREDGGLFAMVKRSLTRPTKGAALRIEVATIMMTTNLIGVIFARSLHYQFYSWYAQQLPLLAWRTQYPIVLKLAILASIEYAWNVFPSTNVSSSVLLVSHIILLLGIWFGWPSGKREAEAQSTPKKVQ
ncbi:glycosyltransferase family 58 protein [Schizopora paradoxa]|uniref:Dol-P-Man:Man(5)GlcNAc(2)-PP-Dol alpha-1,3-mannosyltransferase n=1 Tax=Schizopora paradoxa TaxID=27342 RepID=A0A0H2RKW4_9AGAM|nr:glycosyltransferase family 58 protein [Schizopora paradoxa]